MSEAIRTIAPLREWALRGFSNSIVSLALARWLIGLGLLILVLPRYAWMNQYPSSFFAPPIGLGILFRSHPPAWAIWSLIGGMTLCAVSLTVGYRTRMSGILLALLMLIANTFENSFGKINHDLLLGMLAIFVMSFSDWGKSLSVDSARNTEEPQSAGNWALSYLALLIGLAMLSAAIPKIQTGWLELSTQSVKGHIIQNLHQAERHTQFAAFVLHHTPRAIWECLDWLAVGLEASFLFAMLSERAMRVACATALLFHAGIHLTMDIFFVGNLLAYCVFFNWEWLVAESRLERVQGIVQRFQFLHILLIAGAVFALYFTVGNPVAAILNLLGDGPWLRDLAVTLISAYIALLFLVKPLLRTKQPTSVDPVFGDHPVLLFDGVCTLCNHSVDFFMRHDRKQQFRFASLQGDVGRAALVRYNLPPDYFESIVLIHKGWAKRHSTAALETARLLGFPWSLMYVFILIPPPLRDVVYQFIAKHRYRWFGKKETCRVPTDAERVRILG